MFLNIAILQVCEAKTVCSQSATYNTAGIIKEPATLLNHVQDVINLMPFY